MLNKKYKTKKILAIYEGDDAWKKYLPIRWSQPNVRARTKRLYKGIDMSKSLLVIFTQKKNSKTISIHFYPNGNYKNAKINGHETDELWIIEAPISALFFKDTPKILKKIILDI